MGTRLVTRKRDIFSSIPEELKLQILSLLPIKDAVRTCILSKQWFNVWTKLEEFDFTRWSKSRGTPQIRTLEAQRFSSFLERLFTVWNVSSINKFFLRANGYLDHNRLHTWVSILIQRNVRVLDLQFKVGTHFNLPLSLFRSESLRELRLDLPTTTLRFPDNTCLPNLEKLELSRIDFEDLSIEYLFAATPSLEEVAIRNCIWAPDVNNIAIQPASRLSTLIFETPTICNESCGVIVEAPSLRHLFYDGIIASDYHFGPFSSLADASIFLAFDMNPSVERRNQIGQAAYGVFRTLSSLTRSLTVCDESLQALSFQSRCPLFRQMITMEVVNPLTTFAAEHVLSQLLLRASNIETLFIDKLMLTPTVWSSMKHIFPRLRRFVLNSFSGYQNELDILQLVLSSATVLENMTLRLSMLLQTDSDLRSQALLNFTVLPRNSACTISFDI